MSGHRSAICPVTVAGSVHDYYKMCMRNVVNRQEAVQDAYHANTYAIFGRGAIQPPRDEAGVETPKVEISEQEASLLTFGKVIWQGDIPEGVSAEELKAAKLHYDNHKGELKLLVRGQIVTVKVWDQIRMPDPWKDRLKDNGIMQNSLTARRKWKSLTDNHLPADASTAEQAMLARVRDVAQSTGLALGQQNRSTHEKQGGFEVITRRFSGEGNMYRLTRFLYELDRSEIPVRVVDLSINSKKDGTDDLLVTFGISTLYDPPAAPAKVASLSLTRGGAE